MIVASRIGVLLWHVGIIAVPSTTAPSSTEPVAAEPIAAEPTPAEPAPQPETPESAVTVEAADAQASAATMDQFEAALRADAGARFAPTCTAACPRLHVRVAERERDYDITIRVTDGSGRESEATVKCTICTPREAAGKTAARALELLDATPAEASVSIATSPPGATVEIDGAPAGTTPLRVALAPGRHDIVVRRDGYEPRTRRVEIAAGAQDEIRLQLAEDRSRQRRAMRIAGWTLLAAGIAGMGGGIALVAMDEAPVERNCDGSHVDAFGNCEFRWNTTGPGVGLLVPAVLATGAGAVLLVIGRRDRAGPGRAQARLGVGPGRLALHGRF